MVALTMTFHQLQLCQTITRRRVESLRAAAFLRTAITFDCAPCKTIFRRSSETERHLRYFRTRIQRPPVQNIQLLRDCHKTVQMSLDVNHCRSLKNVVTLEKGQFYLYSTKNEETESIQDKEKSAKPKGLKETSPETADKFFDKVLQDETHVVTKSSRGVGQVIFVSSPKAGLAIVGGLAMGDPYLASLASIGSLASTITAQQSRLNKVALCNGLWSYNGALVGCAAAVFIAPQSILLGAATTVAGAAASTFVAASLGSALDGRMPQWTYAFNITTLTMLLYTQPLLASVSTPTGSDAAEATSHVAATSSSLMDLPLGELVATPLKGISQIFVVESALSGFIILGATSFWYSPKLAQSLLIGSTIGTVTGAFMGAPIEELTIGLWGFNSALTSAAVSVFYAPNKHSYLLSAGGAAATAVLFGGLKSALALVGTPALTLPFCLCMSGCYLLRDDVIPGLQLAIDPHSPEKNTPTGSTRTDVSLTDEDEEKADNL